MLVVAVYLHDLRILKAIERPFRDNAQVEAYPNQRRLLAAPHERPVAAVVLALRDQQGRSTVPFISALRARYEILPIIGVVGITAGDLRVVAAASREGLTDIILFGAEDPWAVVNPLIRPRGTESAIAEVCEALAPYSPPHVSPIVDYCVRNATHPLKTTHLADALGIVRKTLVRRLDRFGFPAPSSLLAWTRLLVAARLLQEPSNSVERVALDLSFASVITLRRQMKGYTGLRPSEVRQRDGLHALLPIFLKTLRHRTLAGFSEFEGVNGCLDAPEAAHTLTRDHRG